MNRSAYIDELVAELKSLSRLLSAHPMISCSVDQNSTRTAIQISLGVQSACSEEAITTAYRLLLAASKKVH